MSRLATSQCFSKKERLKSKKTIGFLFKSGKSFGAYPLRFVWQQAATSPPDDDAFILRFAVSVAKKKFPKATDRNLLRRRVKEAYRLNKAPTIEKLAQANQKNISLMVLFTGKELESFATINAKMQYALRRFSYELLKNAAPEP